MKGFFDTIPDELDESARVDGATPAQVFWGIILPLAAPVLAVVGLLSFIVIDQRVRHREPSCSSRRDKFTLPVGLYGFINDQYAQQWGPFCAGVVLAAVPVVVLFFFLQRFITEGLTARRGQGMTPECTRSLLDQPHHDGSERLRLERRAELGDDVDRAACASRERRRRTRSRVRYVRDGEPRVARAEIDQRDRRRRLVARDASRSHNPATPYRWLLSGGDFGYAWLNALGLHAFDVPDADDFVVSSARPAAPDWHLELGRLPGLPRPLRAVRRSTVAPPEWAIRGTGTSFRRGAGPRRRSSGSAATCAGSRSGSTTSTRSARTSLYLTPVFPARSTHRYDATHVRRVDPLLGGDDALAIARRARRTRAGSACSATSRPTTRATRTTGSSRAPGAPSPSADFFFFDDALPHGYVCWLGVPSLPKLDYGVGRAARAACRGSDSVVRRWLEPPFELDGWRIDVANMTGRLGATRPPRRGRARRATPQRGGAGRTRSSSRSTRTTPAAICAAAAGTGR